MPDSLRNLDRMLDDLSRQMQSSGSILPAVRQRIDSTRMQPRLPVAPLGIAAAVAITCIAAWIILQPGAPSQLPPAMTEIRIDDTIVAEHLAIVVDRDAVLVAWSYRGGERPARNPTDAYAEYPLGTARLADRQFVWSLFATREPIIPALQPPTLRIAAPGGRSMLLAASPSPMHPSDMDHFLQSNDLPNRPNLADLRNVIRQHRQSNNERNRS